MKAYPRLSEKQILQQFKTKNSAFWNKVKNDRVLDIFHRAALNVPAYSSFLAKHNISPSNIKTLKDFEGIPSLSKKNYLRKYPFKDLCWKGDLVKPIVYTATSGSTGEPFYFPRESRLDWEYSVLAEHFLTISSSKSEGPVLLIVAFGMGVWIGGVFTYQAFEIAGKRVGNISIITPGINKKEIFHALKFLAPNYAEVILAGYPPFLKDIVDEASDNKVNFKKMSVRFLFAAESFSEKFRDYLAKNVELGNPYLDTFNIYGSADLGAMAFETPTSILIRRLSLENKKLFADIFSSIKKIPTLAQYNPHFINFEEQSGEIFVTADNTLPLVRYAIGDSGGVLTFSEMQNHLLESGINLKKEAEKVGIKCLYELPFVFVYERKDFSTTLYGLQIYPEHIREALLNPGISPYLTGRFTALTKFNRSQNQYLEIHIELQHKKKVSGQLKKRVLDQIVTALHLKNSEFRELHSHLGKRALPKIVFWPAEHPAYFKPGIKQKWVIK